MEPEGMVKPWMISVRTAATTATVTTRVTSVRRSEYRFPAADPPRASCSRRERLAARSGAPPPVAGVVSACTAGLLRVQAHDHVAAAPPADVVIAGPDCAESAAPVGPLRPAVAVVGAQP